jgi:capsular polysaccharide transport system permease protein
MTTNTNLPSEPLGPKLIYRAFVVVYFILLSATIAYLWLFAQDRYMTSAAFKISRQDISSGSSLPLSIPGLSDSGSMDSQISIGFIQSADFLIALEQEFDLQKHFSSPDRDWYFRLDADTPLEERLIYYRKHIKGEFDSETGLTVLTVMTFDPQLSHKVAEAALKKADKFINSLNQSIADQRLGFIQEEFDRCVKRVEECNQRLLEFQNENDLINPEQNISQNLNAVQVLRMDRLKTETELKSLMKDSPQSPLIETMTSHLASLDQSIANESDKLSGPERGRLNQLLSEFYHLRMQANFALEMRSSAQAMLEKTRVDAIATSRFFSVIQKPYLPEDVSAPRRWYVSITIFVLGMLVFLILRGLARSAMERF